MICGNLRIHVCDDEAEEDSISDEDSTIELESEESEDESSDSGNSLDRKKRFCGVICRKDGKYWVSTGFVDGKNCHLCTGKTEEICAERTRAKVKQLRLSGKRVANNYGSPHYVTFFIFLFLEA